MRSSTDVGALRNRHACTDSYPPEAVKSRTITDRRVMTDTQIPGTLDADRPSNANDRVKLCSKCGKQQPSPAVPTMETEPEKHCLDRSPKDTSSFLLRRVRASAEFFIHEFVIPARRH